MFEAQKAASRSWNLCFRKEEWKDETNMYLYSFFMVMYKKNDICFEMNFAFIVKLIMLHLFFIIKVYFYFLVPSLMWLNNSLPPPSSSFESGMGS